MAGLQAIATARRLGAVVEAFDVRPAVKEQVKSLGATFIEVPMTENLEDKGGYAQAGFGGNPGPPAEAPPRTRQSGRFHYFHRPGSRQAGPAPDHRREMVADMKPGSVVIDLAAE